ncbi:MAG: hypothetical protein KBC02_01525 [Candidatus Pacebacteria bacterium]|nr:hypothetical protein [Candidatus Paceibacterota bacterium]
MTHERKSLIAGFVGIVVSLPLTAWVTIILIAFHGMSDFLGPLVALTIGCSLGATAGVIAFLFTRFALKAFPATQKIE